MNKLEQQVCSLELAKKLEKLGVNKESIFQYRIDWIAGDGGMEKEKVSIVFKQNYETKGTNENGQTQGSYLVSAFTVAELGEMFNIQGIDSFESHCLNAHGWSCNCGFSPSKARVAGMDKSIHTEYGDTEADARAKTLIYLLENNLITTPK